MRKPLRASARRPRAAPGHRYIAFLSYSHHDSDTAGWLHEALEEFQVPKRLVGTLTDQGAVPKRLTPIFRDRHELAAAGDLGEEIEEAIAGSRFLIVLCSPHAAQSRWIDEEIACFKKMHREDRILAAIVDGEPFASDMEGREAQECFPPALRVHYDRRGRPTAQRAEPIAADLRPSGDGRHTGLLKLVAGLLGVGLDDLVQREERRRQKRLYAVTAASVAGMLFASGLAYTAIDARDEARDQRREADKLVGFMLGDLRQKLEPIGRLDVLDSVGQRALAYYEGQDTADLTDDALAQRSKALTLMGEMAQARGDIDGALRRYREAMAGTQEALRRSPDDPKRLFDHAQNVFWVGSIDYQRGQLEQAAAAFGNYRKLADRMIALDASTPQYRLERIYADSALGAVQMDQRRHRDAAVNFQALLEKTETLLSTDPRNVEYRNQLLNALAWLADARERNGEIDEAVGHRERQIDVLGRMWQTSPGDAGIKRYELAARRSLARLLASRGQMREAFVQASLNSAVLAFLTKAEPANTEWIQTGAGMRLEQAELYLAANRVEEARQSEAAGCAASRELVERNRTVDLWRTGLQRRCAMIRTRIAMRVGDQVGAMAQSRLLLALARTEKNPVDRAMATASARLLLGTAQIASGQTDIGKATLRAAIAAWPKGVEEAPQELAMKATLLDLAAQDSKPIRNRLAAMGYRHPLYVTNHRGNAS